MREKVSFLRWFLRVLSAASLLGLFYALWAVVTAAGLKSPDMGVEWPLTGLVVVSGLLGLGVAALTVEVRIKPWIRDVILWILCAAAAAAGVLLSLRFYPQIRIAGWICAGIFSALGWQLGILFYKRQPGILWLLGGGGVQLFCFLILRLGEAGRHFPSAGFVWTFFAAAVCVTAGANYENIDGHMRRRGHSTARLPESIRKNNLILIGGLFALAALLMLLRQPLGEALRTVLRWIIVAVLWVFSMIASLFGGRSEGGGAYGMPSQDQGTGESGDDRSELFRWIVFGILAVVVIVFSAKPLARYVRDRFRALIAAIRRWLAKLLHLGTRRVESADYVDVTETVGNYVPRKRTEKKSAAIRSWRKRLRENRRMRPGRDRYCADWNLLREGIAFAGASSQPGDAPTETALRVQRILPATRVVPLSQETDRICFSGRTCPADAEELEQILAQLEKDL